MRFALLALFTIGCEVEDPDTADLEEYDADGLMIGGGCHPSSPNYPDCAEGGPSIPSPNCSGHDGCYWVCRQQHQCTSGAECDALADCLDQCDVRYPNC